MGKPHPRLLWLDVLTDADKPTLMWQDGDAIDEGKVKEKDKLPLIDIQDIKAGQASANLKRSGKEADAVRYMSFTGPEGRTLDIEASTQEARDWLFARFADLFQAYATAKIEGLARDDITARVAQIMDGAGGAAGSGGAAAPAPAGPRRDEGGGGRGGSGRARSPRGSPRGAGADAGGGGGGGVGSTRARSRSPRGGAPTPASASRRGRSGSLDGGNYYGGGGGAPAAGGGYRGGGGGGYGGGGYDY